MAELALLYCVKCSLLFPTLRPRGAPSLTHMTFGITANECPGCGACLVFGGVHTERGDRPMGETLSELALGVDKHVAHLMRTGADRRPVGKIVLGDEPNGIVAWAEEKETEQWAGIGIAWKES